VADEAEKKKWEDEWGNMMLREQKYTRGD